MRKWTKNIVAVAVPALAALAAALLICFNAPRTEEAAYTPYPRDPLAAPVEMEGDVPLLNAGAYMVGINPAPTLNKDGACEIGFQNPAENACFLMLDIRIKGGGLLIYRTGLVAPGEGIARVALSKEALERLGDAREIAMTVHSFSLEKYEDMGDVNIGGMLTEG